MRDKPLEDKTIREMFEEFDEVHLISEIILLGESGGVRRIVIENVLEFEDE